MPGIVLRLTIALVVSSFVSVASPAALPTLPPLAGLELADALRLLEPFGLAIVFTSETVHPGMRVKSEPRATEPIALLDELLAPFGLEAEPADGGILVIVARSRQTVPSVVAGRVLDSRTGKPLRGAYVQVAGVAYQVTGANGKFRIPLTAGIHSLHATMRGFESGSVEGLVLHDGEILEFDIRLEPTPRLQQEIEVHAAPASPPREPMATTSTPVPLEHVPALGDPIRGLSLSAGTSSGDITAQFSVRGGRPDEVKIVLDGQELYDAFHLKDYSSARSIVPSGSVKQASLIRGGISAAEGDRMGGVVDLTTGAESPRSAVSLSLLEVVAQTIGTSSDRRLTWMLSLRNGLLDISGNPGPAEDPSFWDAFGKVSYDLNGSNAIRLHALIANDDVRYRFDDEETVEDVETDYSSRYAWLTHDINGVRGWLAQSVVSWSSITRDRTGDEIDDDNTFSVSDQRDLEILSLTQSWSRETASKNLLRLGWEVRRFDAFFDYSSVLSPDYSLPTGEPAPDEIVRQYTDEPSGRHYALWITDRFGQGRLSTEIGLRYDVHSLPDEALLSPRVGFVLRSGPGSVLRANWGIYYQSQRPYELQVQDGESALNPAEKSLQWNLGYERQFDRVGAPVRLLRVDLFRRSVGNPRPRYENLLEVSNRFPEAEPDRVRIAPERSLARGVEFTLHSRVFGSVDGAVSYTWQETLDWIDGDRVLRGLDQTHSITGNIDYRFARGWNLNAVWLYHTGWPTTPVTSRLIEEPDDENLYTFEFGRLNSERLPNYHRMDLRLSYRRGLRVGVLTTFVELRNVYNRNNIGGFDPKLDGETGEIDLIPDYWPGIVPVVGLSWEF